MNIIMNNSNENIKTVEKAELLQKEFNVELQDWKNKNSENVDSIKTQHFAEYLSQKYLCDNLDKLETFESVTNIRKEVAKQIDQLENHNKYVINEEEYEDANDQIQIPSDNINLCFVGGVSTGKSTILNSIFCEELTQCKIKRTTMCPTIYIENKYTQDFLTKDIFKIISDKNKEIIEKTESGQKLDTSNYEELVFNVGKLDMNILENSYVNVYDIPGLNDARTKHIYYEYLENNFHKFNLIVFIIDIQSGLNTSDEMDMLKFIINNTKEQYEKNKRYIYTLVIVNKADNMQTEEDTDKLEITGELREMFEQVENTIKTEFANNQLKDHVIGVIPLSAIDSYLYRMVKKHVNNFKLSPEQILKIGINENGKKFSMLKPAIQEEHVNKILKDENFVNTMIKLSGFSHLESILYQFLQYNNKGNRLRIDNLIYDLSKLPKLKDYIDTLDWLNLKFLTELFKQYFKIFNNIKLIDIAEYKICVTTFITEFTEILRNMINTCNYINNLISCYDKINEELIIPYIKQANWYNYTTYPYFLINRVLQLMYVKNNGILSINDIINQLNILIKLSKFEKSIIETIFSSIISNIHQKTTILFEDKENIDELINLLDKCCQIDVNLSEFLRFLIINQLCNINNEKLFIKKMLYHRHGEIIISEYILQEFDNSKLSVPFDRFIKGLSASDLDSKEHKLDIYYLNYEKIHNKFNFICV